jgi:hypothetical protein
MSFSIKTKALKQMSSFSIISEASNQPWWTLDEEYFKSTNINWVKLWTDIQVDPYPPQGTPNECILFVFKQLTMHLPLEVIFPHYFVHYCHFCPETLSHRIKYLV